MKQKLFTKPCACKATALALSALALSSAFVGCTDYFGDMTEAQLEALTNAKKRVEDFDQAFIERFGEPAENHQWGQDLPIKPMLCFGDGMTRAAEASGANQNVNVNKNQWCQRNTSGYDLKENNLLIDKFQVPGWPNFDGYYYGSTGEGALKNILTKDQIFSNEYISVQPVGDVTDYEIQFVSTWFRTHQHPKSISLHLTDFFIQNISCDKDQLTYEGYVDDAWSSSDYTSLGSLNAPGPNGTNVEHTSDVVTDDNVHKDGVMAQVERRNTNKSNESLNYSMDYLHFGAVGYPFETTLNLGLGEGWTHVNNYNNGNTNYDPENTKDRNFREIKYIYSSGTEDFACRCSWGTDKPWIHSWVLVKLEWVEPAEFCLDNQPHKREGYYLGFDFHGVSGDTEIKQDGFYSNWIIKISPAHFTPKSEFAKRVMCEDLGGSFDFDYNDVVFDVAFDQNKDEAIISLQAAGGTLPIKVGADIPNASDGFQEAHNLLGNPVDQPINVAAGATSGVAIYRVPVTHQVKDGKQVAEIPIYVKQDGENWISQKVELGASPKNDYQWEPTNRDEVVVGNPGHYNVDKDAKTPLRFVTEVGVKWMKELQGLDYGYNHFWEWVEDPGFLYNLNGQMIHWYDAKSDVSLIYKGDEKPVANPTTTVNTPVLDWWQLDVVPVVKDFNNKGLATDIISIDEYKLETNSIIYKFKHDSEAKHITFAYILKAAPGQEVHASMMPVWIKSVTKDGVTTNKPFYKFNDGREVEITEAIIRGATYRESVWQPSFTQFGSNSAGNGTAGQDINGDYTYVSKFSFNLEDMCVKGATPEQDDYCDYVMLFIKENIDMTGTTLVKETTPPVKKYMVFCLF